MGKSLGVWIIIELGWSITMLAVGPGAVSSPSSEECVEGEKELDQKGVKTSPVLVCNMVGKHYHKITPPVGKTHVGSRHA